MKSFIIKLTIFTGLILTIFFLSLRIKSLNKQVEYATNNEKALFAQYSVLDKKVIQLKMDAAYLSYLNDSITVKIKNVMADNKIKENKIRSLQYQLEHFQKTDTLFVRDTIFAKPDFVLDTCIMDEWNKTQLYLEYPNVIGISSEFKNEKYAIFHHYKEPIKPKKCKFLNWFAKKQTIVEVTVVDTNPYVSNEQQRFIEVIK